MLDIGGWEFLIVAFVLVMVVGPKELPAMLRSFTKLTRQMRTVAREFSEGMNKIAVDAEVSEIKAAMEKARAGDLTALHRPSIRMAISVHRSRMRVTSSSQMVLRMRSR